MSGLGDLDRREQDALFWLCARLLHMDWPIRPESRERLTLLWLEWRDRWSDSGCDLPNTELDRASAVIERGLPRAEGPVDQSDHRTRAAIDVLKSSGHGIPIIRFLFEVAGENGINEEEAAFLRELREHLERVGVNLGAFR